MTSTLLRRAAICLSWGVSGLDMRDGDAVEIIIDAGSTGSRMYLFHSRQGELQESHVVGKKKPGLSSFADNPIGSLVPMKQLFEKFLEKDAAKVGKQKIPVKIYGTAGMRLLNDDKRGVLWKTVSDGLKKYFEAIKDQANFELITTETIPGHTEGFFAVLGVNHLMKEAEGTEEVGCKKYGILDLGGSSTQIGIPSDCSNIMKENSYIQSFQQSGMELTRERVNGKFSAEERASCYFKGYETEKAASRPCTDLVLEAMKEDDKSPFHLQEDWSTLNNAETKFIAVSGYLYVTHFAHWLLSKQNSDVLFLKSYPEPSFAEIKEAANKLCTTKWSDIRGGKHAFTSETKLPHRCFEINYIWTLLNMYMNNCKDCRNVRFTEDINGSEVEWPIGAWLYFNAATKTKKRDEL